MPRNTISKFLKLAHLQMAAESLFTEVANQDIAVGAKFGPGSMTEPSLQEGNRRASLFTQAGATDFLLDWDLVEHQANTGTGFSGTLFKAKRDNAKLGITQGEYVLSFRSTEFADDAARDNQATKNKWQKQMGSKNKWGQTELSRISRTR